MDYPNTAQLSIFCTGIARGFRVPADGGTPFSVAGRLVATSLLNINKSNTFSASSLPTYRIFLRTFSSETIPTTFIRLDKQ